MRHKANSGAKPGKMRMRASESGMETGRPAQENNAKGIKLF